MRYMMLMYSRETAEGPSEEEVEYLIRTHGGVVADARKKGALLAIEGLKPTKTATFLFPLPAYFGVVVTVCLGLALIAN